MLFSVLRRALISTCKHSLICALAACLVALAPHLNTASTTQQTTLPQATVPEASSSLGEAPAVTGHARVPSAPWLLAGQTYRGSGGEVPGARARRFARHLPTQPARWGKGGLGGTTHAKSPQQTKHQTRALFAPTICKPRRYAGSHDRFQRARPSRCTSTAPALINPAAEDITGHPEGTAGVVVVADPAAVWGSAAQPSGDDPTCPSWMLAYGECVVVH